MDIHSSEMDWFLFSMPYNGKRLLNDSVKRTLDGYSSIGNGDVLKGLGNILLARVESVAACAFVALSASIIIAGSAIISPLLLIPTIVLNLASRVPGISSFESVQNFTQGSSNVIRRAFKLHIVAIPVIFLFLTVSCINTLLPGILGVENIFFSAIHKMVESMGPLKTIRATVPEKTSVVGTEDGGLSILDGIEEYFRALSCENYLEERVVDSLTSHYTYSTNR